MGTTLQPVVEPIHRIIHTDREVQIEWREEIGINKLIIALVAMGKLRLRHHLNGIIPFAGSLESQLAGVSDQVIGSLQAVHGISFGSLIAQSHLQLVLPLHLLLVVIVGLHGESTQQRIVALATLIPVVRHVVLEELQIVIACESPEVRSEDDDVHRCRIRFNRLRCHILNDASASCFCCQPR